MNTTPPLACDPGVAVLIAAYNCEATIARAVASALAEPEVREVCVVDDASSDATAATARACAAPDKTLTVLSLEANRGPSAARNAGLAATSSPWVAILDADDFVLPGRFARLMAAREGADFVADALIRVPEEAAHAEAPPAFTARDARPVSFAEFVRGNLGAEGHGRDLGFVKPLINRSFIDLHGLRYQEDMRLGEDYEFYARALALGARFVLTPPAGYVSVDRAGSLSNRHSIADLAALLACDAALEHVRPLSAEERSALQRHRIGVDKRLQWRRLIEAMKQKDVRAALATFRSPEIALELTRQLALHAWMRGPGRVFNQSGQHAR